MPGEDLEHILRETAPLWEQMRGQRLFLTGGTGFFGCWLVESFCRANRVLGLGARVTVLTRDPGAFRRKAPHLAEDGAVELHAGDVRSFAFPEGEFRFVIHAATEASVSLAKERPLEMLTTIVDGTRHLLEFVARCGARQLLLTSSGAVYGVQPPELTHVPESYTGGPDPMDPASVYGEGKRIAEQMCVLYAAEAGVECKVARCFAFVGPHLPLDGHFAVGNFVRDLMAGRPVLIEGDGTPMRSYLYAADLAVWLWTMLFKAPSGRAYNVGSEEDLSIAELAGVVAGALGVEARIEVRGTAVAGAATKRYVPSTARAREELGLRAAFGLAEGIRRMAQWYGYAAPGEG